MRILTALCTCCLLSSATTLSADDNLRSLLDDSHALGADFWIYNDINAGLEEAQRTGKPLFVTFRCIPCENCKSFDAEVAGGRDEVEEMAEQHFVAVRQVEMKNVDLTQFQFDHDLSWAAMFLNADGTVYARYGTQSAEGADAYNSIDGLKQTMLRVLELHRNYPDNRAELAGKRPERKPYRTYLEMPGLEDPDRFRGATTRRNCIHCHMVHDAENLHALRTGSHTREDLFHRYPLPDTLGLSIDAASGIRIASVQRNSPAARAGLSPREQVTHMNGQAITSIADMQWVLHHLPGEADQVEVTGSDSGPVTVRLPDGWKEDDFAWRISMFSIPPAIQAWGKPVDANRLRQLRLPAGRNALEVTYIDQNRAGGRAVRDAGIRVGDVIIDIDGHPVPDHFRYLLKYLKENYDRGDRIPFTIRRGNQQAVIRVPVVE